MKKVRKILYVLLAFCLLLTGSLSTSALNIGDVGLEEQKAVLSVNLSAVMANADESELIPVDIWVEEVDIDEVEAAALEETGLNKAKIAELDEAGVELTIEEVDKYITAERQIYAERQKALNEQIMQNTLGSSEMGVPLAQRNVYVSIYAPVISVELTKSEVQQMAKCKQVDTIYYAPNVEITTVDPVEDPTGANSGTEGITLNQAFERIRANRTRDEKGYTGTGIKIGQFEPGLPDTSASHLRNSSIQTTATFSYAGKTNHATRVAGIMVSTGNVRGIVPDAQLYSISTEPDAKRSVEWLLGAEGGPSVHVINMSAGLLLNGIYAADCKWFDHIALNHSVHFVVSAGNEGKTKDDPDASEYVTSPAMAANVITVGAVNQTYSARADFSSYLEASSTVLNKPDICAPGEYLYLFDGFDSGTSYAAPMVTAIVAQMIQARPALATTQDTVKAILTAAIHDGTLRYTPSNYQTDGYGQCGAGLVDALSAVNVARYQNYTLNKYIPKGTETGNYFEVKKFTVASSATLIRVSLAWLKNNRISGDHHENGTPTDEVLADIDMQVFDPNGNRVGSSTSSRGNVEIVEFVPTMAGEYTIKLCVYSRNGEKFYYGLAWW